MEILLIGLVLFFGVHSVRMVADGWRTNTVARWEYRPGSTLYFVWQQTRSSSEPFGDFEFGRDRRALFAAHPDNIFLVKASYWFSL